MQKFSEQYIQTSESWSQKKQFYVFPTVYLFMLQVWASAVYISIVGSQKENIMLPLCDLYNN